MGAAAARSQPASETPDASPDAIRATLSPSLAAEFDREWELVLDRVKRTRDLDDLRAWLDKWRHTSYAESQAPGTHERLLDKAQRILRTRANPDAVPEADMDALIAARLGR